MWIYFQTELLIGGENIVDTIMGLLESCLYLNNVRLHHLQCGFSSL